MIRDLLLGVHAGAWLIAVVITAASNGGQVPAELWAVLPGGIGLILTAMRADTVGRRQSEDKK